MLLSRNFVYIDINNLIFFHKNSKIKAKKGHLLSISEFFRGKKDSELRFFVCELTKMTLKTGASRAKKRPGLIKRAASFKLTALLNLLYCICFTPFFGGGAS